MLLWYMLVTQIRDMVPALREAVNVFVWALRQLDGQVYCLQKANALGILPGSHALDKRVLNRVEKQLIHGLCLLEGALPISHLNPGLHHFVHYARYTSTHGLLRTFWMYSFERFVTPTLPVHTDIYNTFVCVRVACRYNKPIKILVRDVSSPEYI